MTAIFTTIQDFFIGILVALLPASPGLPGEVSNAIITFVSYLNGLNLIFPISTMFQILGLFIAFEITLLLLKTIKFIMNLVRGSGA